MELLRRCKIKIQFHLGVNRRHVVPPFLSPWSAHAKQNGRRQEPPAGMLACRGYQKQIYIYIYMCVYVLPKKSAWCMKEGAYPPTRQVKHAHFFSSEAAHPPLSNAQVDISGPKWDSGPLERSLALHAQSQSVLRVSACNHLAAILFSSCWFCAAPCEEFQKEGSLLEATSLSFFLFLSVLALEDALREVMPW